MTYHPYAGIGSRQTPLPILQQMKELAGLLHTRGYTLRSGGAIGADQWFESGLPLGAFKEIYRAYDATEEAMKIAASVHPAWDKCSPNARMLHGRNVFQILGKNLSYPQLSNFVICWTPNGELVGGTATALRLALLHKVPIFNLGDPAMSLEKLSEFIGE